MPLCGVCVGCESNNERSEALVLHGARKEAVTPRKRQSAKKRALSLFGVSVKKNKPYKSITYEKICFVG